MPQYCTVEQGENTDGKLSNKIICTKRSKLGDFSLVFSAWNRKVGLSDFVVGNKYNSYGFVCFVFVFRACFVRSER